MTLRPNAHDIIRTWDFYTIVRSLYLTGDIGYRDAVGDLHIAGRKDRQVKIRGHRVQPDEQRAWARFKRNRLGHISLFVFAAMLILFGNSPVSALLATGL